MKIASSKRDILVTRNLLYSKGFRSSRPKFILLKISGDITSGDNTGYHSKHRDQAISNLVPRVSHLTPNEVNHRQVVAYKRWSFRRNSDCKTLTGKFSLHNRRFLSQARRTRHFARNECEARDEGRRGAFASLGSLGKILVFWISGHIKELVV